VNNQLYRQNMDKDCIKLPSVSKLTKYYIKFAIAKKNFLILEKADCPLQDNATYRHFPYIIYLK